jgi:hypothetical protein
MARKAQQLTGVMVRLPEKLRRAMEQAASENGRSMNSEIIYRLEESVSGKRDEILRKLLLKLAQVTRAHRQLARDEQRAPLKRQQRIDETAGNGEEGKS